MAVPGTAIFFNLGWPTGNKALMKYILIFFILLLSHSSFAQLGYSVDSFKYADKSILTRRSSELQIDSFRRLSRIAFQLTMYVQKLQKDLDEAKSAVAEERTIYDYTLAHAQEVINQAKEFYPAFGKELVLYQQELDFYVTYKKALPE